MLKISPSTRRSNHSIKWATPLLTFAAGSGIRCRTSRGNPIFQSRKVAATALPGDRTAPKSSARNDIKVTTTRCKRSNQIRRTGLVSHRPHLSLANPAFPLTAAHHCPNAVLPLSLEVTVEEPGTKDEKLNRAVNTLIPAALERRQGILVIQRDYGKYIVRVDQEVPCGMIHESRQTRDG